MSSGRQSSGAHAACDSIFVYPQLSRKNGDSHARTLPDTLDQPGPDARNGRSGGPTAGPTKGPQPDKTYTSAKEVVALIAKAKSDRKQDQPTLVQNLLRLAPYNANLEYRAGVGPAAQHEQEAEMFYVIDGSGTLVTGGKLVNEKRTNAANLTGTAIATASPRPSRRAISSSFPRTRRTGSTRSTGRWC